MFKIVHLMHHTFAYSACSQDLTKQLLVLNFSFIDCGLCLDDMHPYYVMPVKHFSAYKGDLPVGVLSLSVTCSSSAGHCPDSGTGHSP